MSGVSIGFFDPALIVGDAEKMTRAIEKTFSPHLIGKASFPLHVASIAKSQVSYALVGGHIPIHRDPVGENDPDGRIFQLVIGVRNRPVLLTARPTDDNNALIGGKTEMFTPFGIGALELRVGMAVHFDITETWHGIAALPRDCGDDFVDKGRAPIGRPSLPMACIIQVSGFAPDDVAGAVNAAAAMVTADRAVSEKVR